MVRFRLQHSTNIPHLFSTSIDQHIWLIVLYTSCKRPAEAETFLHSLPETADMRHKMWLNQCVLLSSWNLNKITINFVKDFMSIQIIFHNYKVFLLISAQAIFLKFQSLFYIRARNFFIMCDEIFHDTTGNIHSNFPFSWKGVKKPLHRGQKTTGDKWLL